MVLRDASASKNHPVEFVIKDELLICPKNESDVLNIGCIGYNVHRVAWSTYIVFTDGIGQKLGLFRRHWFRPTVLLLPWFHSVLRGLQFWQICS